MGSISYTTHRETIEALETELAKALGVEAIHADQFLQSRSVVETKKAHDEKAKLAEQVAHLKSQLDKVYEEKEDLKYELDRRAIKGDYNPTDTKVLHFR